jgi:hypothetical protein
VAASNRATLVHGQVRTRAQARVAVLLGEGQGLLHRGLLFLRPAQAVDPLRETQEDLGPPGAAQQALDLQRPPRQPHRLVVAVAACQVLERSVQVAQRPLAATALQEVLAELDGRGAVGRLAGAPLQRLADRGVVPLTQEAGLRLVERLLHLVVVEDIAHARGAHDPMRILQASQPPEQRDVRQAEHVAHEQRIELEPATGRHVEQLALLLVELRHPRLDQLAHRRRDLDPPDHLGAHPGAVVALGDPFVLAQAADDLEDEEGVAVGLRGDR